VTLLVTMLVIAVIWGTTGALFAVALHTRGHKLLPWLVLGLAFGPLTPLLAMDATRAQGASAPITLREAEESGGALSVLVGLDESPSSDAALVWVRENLMPLGVRVTLATAIDSESAANPVAFDDKARAEAHLAVAAESLGESVGIAILPGRAVDALPRYALEHSHDVIVVGQHEGFMPLISTAKTLAKRSPITLVVAG